MIYHKNKLKVCNFMSSFKQQKNKINTKLQLRISIGYILTLFKKPALNLNKKNQILY